MAIYDLAAYDAESPPERSEQIIVAKGSWRLDLLGTHIITASDAAVPTERVLDAAAYDYVALYFCADYCNHCKLFAPKLLEAIPALLRKRCKVLAVSNDRMADAYEVTRRKLDGIDFLPCDTLRTANLRDNFGLKTIPALVVLRNSDAANPTVLTTDGRNALVDDPSVENFPWSKVDWRLDLLGTQIKTSGNNAAVPTKRSLDTASYDYVALYFSADYCNHCKLFAPKLLEAIPALLRQRCKVLSVSNDRTAEAYEVTRRKLNGIDFLPYDTSRTANLRDKFGLKTIPAVVVLRNVDAPKPMVLTTDGRNAIVDDPSAENFPWSQRKDVDGFSDEAGVGSTSTGTRSLRPAPISAGDRLLVRGRYGNWYSLGHRSNPEKPDQMYMDEQAVRIRAGIINILTWLALINVFYWRFSLFFKIVLPIVMWDFFIASLTGLTPLAPIGTAATFISIILNPQPHWKPASPKRFAWAIGFSLLTLVLVFVLLREQLGGRAQWAIGGTIIAANLFTWLESSCGFCVGCFVYNQFVVPLFDLEDCAECKL